MPAEAGTPVTSQQGLGSLQKLSDSKWITDLGPRLRGDDVAGWERV
jgi:hypothetical protein